MSSSKSIWSQGVGLLVNCDDATEISRIMVDLSLLATNRFRWSNLPKGIESRHIEQMLFNHGAVAFYEHDDRETGTKGFYCLPCNSMGKHNVFGEPTQYSMTAENGIHHIKPASEVVRIMNNDFCYPTRFKVFHYAQQLANVEDSLFANIDQQKFPFIVSATKNLQLTIKNFFKKFKRGDRAIFTDERLANSDSAGVKAIDTKVPYVADKLQQHKNNLEAELLTKLGINNTNANNGKKERLLVDEVNVNNGHILLYSDIEFKNRELACKQINEKFGLDVKVERVLDTLNVNFLGKVAENNEINDNKDNKKKSIWR